MPKSNKQLKKENNQIKTFSVPLSSERFKETIFISTNAETELFNQAFHFHSKGNILKASKCYQSCINQGSKNHMVFYNYGILLQDIGKLKEAAEITHRAIELKPDYANAYVNLGSIMKDLGQFKEAEIHTRKAIQLKPDLANAYYNLGTILSISNLDRLKEAEIHTRKSIELQPDLANAHYNLGIISNALGDPYKAIKAFKEAIKYSPTYLDAIFNLGSTLINIRKKEEGKKYLEKILALQCKDIDKDLINLKKVQKQAIYKLIHCLFHEGDFESTKILLNKIPENEFNHSYKIACLLGLDKAKAFQSEYKVISNKNLCNSLIGSAIDHANIIYKEKFNSTFCNEAINYIIHKNLKEEEFPNRICDLLISMIHQNSNKEKVRNGINDISKTKGNLFSLEYPFIKELKSLIENQINNYRFHFRDSQEGFILNWPREYKLGGWLINTRAGGLLKPHMHESSWISGSFYLKVPKTNDNEGNIAFNPKGPLYPDKEKIFPEKILNISSRDICIFPSSLFHYTIPFNSTEERICFVFDLMPK